VETLVNTKGALFKRVVSIALNFFYQSFFFGFIQILRRDIETSGVNNPGEATSWCWLRPFSIQLEDPEMTVRYRELGTRGRHFNIEARKSPCREVDPEPLQLNLMIALRGSVA
jgi:hypothetical protein